MMTRIQRISQEIRHQVMECFAITRPEFLNRVDETVVFQTLNKKELSHRRTPTSKVAQRLHEKIALSFTEKRRISLRKRFMILPRHRPLKRAIQDLLPDELLYALGTKDEQRHDRANKKNDQK